MLQCAQLDGLIDVDEEIGSVAPASRLLLVFDGLHDYVAQLEDRWAEEDCDITDHFAALVHRGEDSQAPSDTDATADPDE